MTLVSIKDRLDCIAARSREKNAFDYLKISRFILAGLQVTKTNSFSKNHDVPNRKTK